jgi:hypothetical protein
MTPKPFKKQHARLQGGHLAEKAGMYDYIG